MGIAGVAVLYAFISFVQFIIDLLKLAYWAAGGIKCEGKVGKVVNVETGYNGKKNRTMYTREVIYESEKGVGTAHYHDLVVGDLKGTVTEGQTYPFYINEKTNKAKTVKEVRNAPLSHLIICAVCIAIVVLCFWIPVSLN